MNDQTAGAGGPQGQGQFGRLKPETFAVYTSPTAAATNLAEATAPPASTAPAEEGEKATKASQVATSNGAQVSTDDMTKSIGEAVHQDSAAGEAVEALEATSKPTEPEGLEQPDGMLAIAPELMDTQVNELPDTGAANGKESEAAQSAKNDNDVVLDPAILEQSDDVEKANVDGQISQLLEGETNGTETDAVDAQGPETA